MARKPTLLSRVAAWALAVARRKLPDYSCPKSPHCYTQPQLLALMVLRAFTKQTYRGIVELLEESDGLRRVLELDRVPRHTTLEEFASRVVTTELLETLTAEVLAICQENGLQIEAISVDSTGLAATPASIHYLGRGGGRRYRPWVKLSLAIACPCLLAAASVIGPGPRNDLIEARELSWHAASRVHPAALYADAGYDAEWLHGFWRYGVGTRTVIPPVARGGFGMIKTPWRSYMNTLFEANPSPAGYVTRLCSESFHSGMKRSTGDKLTARTNAARHTEAGFRLLAYQIRRA